jgi:hypothetical protein
LLQSFEKNEKCKAEMEAW